MNMLNFDATGVDTTNHYEALPAGDYLVMITASQIRKTKDMRGEYLELTLEVQDGPHRGHKLWDRLNLDNPNPKAVEIAQRQLAQICHGVGVLQLSGNAEPLHYKPLVAMVKVKSDDRGMSNEVKGYKASAAPGMAPARPPAAAAPRAAPAAAAAPGMAPARPPAAAAPRAAPAAAAMPWATARA